MSKRLLLVNLLLLVLSGFFAARLVWTVWRQPPPPQFSVPPSQVSPIRATIEDGAPGNRPPLETYRVVATRNLFSPNRSDSGVQAGMPASPLFLYGVVIGGGVRVAYLENPVTKRLAEYRVGDPVAGGQLDQIEADHVVVRQGGVPLTVMLRDPRKPQAGNAPPAAAAAPPTPQPSGGSSPPPGPSGPQRVPPAVLPGAFSFSGH